MLSVDRLVVDILGSRILHGVSIDVAAGELVCLLGRNGAGKSTTFRAIMGQRAIAGGGIRFRGASIAGRPTFEIARSGIGFSPEESEVFADLTVAENIELPTRTRPGPDAAARIAFAYEVFPKLTGYRERGGGQLSGGERKMLSIARALALGPELLLLDEPFEGLSPVVIPQIADGIASIRATGRAILMAESQFYHVPEFADRLYIIERGEIVFAGAPALARDNAAIMRLLDGTG